MLLVYLIIFWIPSWLESSLNNLKLQDINDCGALRYFVNFLTSKAYLQALENDYPGSLSSALDEMIRHAASLRRNGVDVLIEILNTITKLGFGTEVSSLLQEYSRSYVHVPMETNLE